jgi:SH3-like domain-containing protein
MIPRAPFIAPPTNIRESNIRGKLRYRHNETGRIWTSISQTANTRLLRDEDGTERWINGSVLSRQFTLVSRPQHLECSCALCRCPHPVTADGEVCRKCGALDVHDGKAR